MILLTITTDEQQNADSRPAYTARLGRITPQNAKPSRWFGELLDTNGKRLSYTEIVSYSGDPLKVSASLLSNLQAEVYLSQLQ